MIEKGLDQHREARVPQHGALVGLELHCWGDIEPVGDTPADSDGQAHASPSLEGWLALADYVARSIEDYVRRYTITTQACLERVGESCDDADFGNEHEGRCVSHDGLCECDAFDGGGAFIGGMTWSYAGPGLVNLENQQSRYCVEGDRLSLEVMDIESGTPFLKLYRRRSS